MIDQAILLATPHYRPRIGGVENYVYNLARQLRARDRHRVVVITTVAPGTAAGRCEDTDGVTVYRLPAHARVSRAPLWLGWVRRIRQVIEAENVVLVNGHAPGPLFTDAAAFACGPVPFVLTYHSGRMRVGRAVPDALCAAYEWTLLTRTAHQACEVICSSDFVAADQPELFLGRSTTISPGVDLSLFTVSPVPHEPRVLFVGSLEHASAHQSLTDLIKAISRVAQTVPSVRLDVVGSGSTTGYRKLVGRLGLGARVTFRGPATIAELAAAYRQARVVALPARYGNLPTVIVEAMASGRPVVTTRIGGIPTLVTDGHNGLLVEPGDHAALCVALTTVLTCLECAQHLASTGRDHVEQELSWQRQSDRTIEVFERALDPARRTRTVAVVAPYYPPKIGGVERYTARLTRAVSQAPDMRAAVITTNTAGRGCSATVEHGVLIVRLGTWGRLSNTPLNPLWPLQVRWWLRRLGAEVVNAHAPVPGLADVAMVVSGRRATVLTYHSGSMCKGDRRFDRLIDMYEGHVLPRVCSRARVLVAVSPVSLASTHPGAVQVTPGVDTDMFTCGRRPSTRPRTITYVGRIDRSSDWKGLDVLVHAFAFLPDVPTARLRLVGGGDAVPDLAALVDRLDLADHVDFSGELTGKRLIDAFRDAAVLVLPSRREAESFGMALVEAMACGTPVVASNVGGIPHVVSHEVTGLLVPPGDVPALAAACRRVLLDGDLADRLGAAGRRRALERYSWPGLTDRYLEIFRSLG